MESNNTKTIADVVNLRGIVEEVLRDYNIDEQRRFEIADRIYERYRNTVRIIATKYLEAESEKRSTLAAFNSLTKGPK